MLLKENWIDQQLHLWIDPMATILGILGSWKRPHLSRVRNMANIRLMWENIIVCRVVWRRCTNLSKMTTHSTVPTCTACSPRIANNLLFFSSPQCCTRFVCAIRQPIIYLPDFKVNWHIAETKWEGHFGEIKKKLIGLGSVVTYPSLALSYVVFWQWKLHCAMCRDL